MSVLRDRHFLIQWACGTVVVGIAAGFPVVSRAEAGDAPLHVATSRAGSDLTVDGVAIHAEFEPAHFATRR